MWGLKDVKKMCVICIILGLGSPKFSERRHA